MGGALVYVFTRLDELRQDVVLALRSLRSHPSYALVVVATLALGIAANSLIFSFMNPYLIRELPFGNPDQLVQLGQVDPVHGWDAARFSLPQVSDWKEIYGLIAYSVAQRRREIGIRMALGATARDVRAVVVGEGLRLTAVGVAIGLVLALVVARLMAAMLFGISPFDPVTFATVVGIFATTAVVASVLPASEAARTNPVVVLRYD